MKKNMRRVSLRVTAQTLYNLERLRKMGDLKSLGRVVDKLVREKMISLHKDHVNAVKPGAPLTQEELNTIRTGGIWYKKAEIHDVQVKFAACTATVYSRIHVNSEVGGNAVRFPFIVTEVYVMENGKWQLSTLAFTRTLGE